MTASIALPEFFGIQDIVGRGRHCTVVRAADHRTGRSVAVKVFQPARWLGVREANALRSRVADAMTALADLRHPYVARVLDVGEFRDSLYVCREYVDGEALRLALRQSRGLRPDDAARIVRQVACGIDAISVRGGSHGAVNGGNVILTRAGARLTDAAFARTAGSFTVAGVPSRLSRAGDLPDDIAALAALTIAVVTGRSIACGASPLDLPPPMRPLVGRALTGHHRRYRSATEFADALFPAPAAESAAGAWRISTTTGLAGAAALLLAPSLIFSHAPVPALVSASVAVPSVVRVAAAPVSDDRLAGVRVGIREQGLSVLAIPEVADLVGLREPQRLAIEAYLKEQRVAVEKLVSETAAGRSVDYGAQMGSLRQQARERILGLLDAGQLARWGSLERAPESAADAGP